jgi:Na+/H+ antiporter NhaD/arsenite permease-like protein
VLSPDRSQVDQQLDQSIASTAQIIFFLIGAMTIVEVIDAHNGFEVITSLIRTRSQVALIWLAGFVTFFLSAILDNLTTTIVVISLVRRLLGDPSDRSFFAAMIVIAANAGGAWSPIGDVTTTMLWIGGQISPASIVVSVFIASLLNIVLPLVAVSYRLKGKAIVPPLNPERTASATSPFERNLIFYLGLGLLVLVPAFKAFTHLPPFMGILFGLGILWMVGELIHRRQEDDEKRHLTLVHALTRIDMASISSSSASCSEYPLSSTRESSSCWRNGST